MHRIMKCTIALAAVACSTAAWAQDDITYTSTAGAKDITRGYLEDEVAAINPQIGVVGFRDPFTGNYDSRGMAGLGIDVNLAKVMNPNERTWFVGPSSGAMVSHLGNPSSNFFGTQSGAFLGNGGSNLLVIPANAKVGYTFAGNYRISAHGGGNVIYRSIVSAMNLSSGGSDVANGDSGWAIYPNVGGEFEVGLGKSIALMVRPDWTFAPSDTIFMGSLALGIPLS